MDPREAIYSFWMGIYQIILVSGLWKFIGPFLLMFLVLNTLRLAWRSARGDKAPLSEDLESLTLNVHQTRQRVDLYRAGLNTEEIRRARAARPGSRFRF